MRKRLEQPVLRGWICRQWTEKHGDWTSEFDRFRTEEEAIEWGQSHIRAIKSDETAREFEVYKDFANFEDEL